ncbi:ABC transporter substrate-binding protein [Moorena producens]|uniref:ABC transporter substrate-binding protein n=1 Tax=Moorena producens TaxID=1155739 RepID=UPI003C744748
MTSRREFTRLSLFLLGLGLANCTQTPNQPSANRNLSSEDAQLRIWWMLGYLPEENEVIVEIVRGWEKESGLKAELRLVPPNTISQDTLKAIDQGNAPDVVFTTDGNFDLFPNLAWTNKLADVSDLLNPIKYDFFPTALQAVYYGNNITKKRSYYAVPIAQTTVHVHYWRSLLEEVGLSDREIPQEWDAFWNFWKQAQNKLRASGRKNIYGLGLCMSAVQADTLQIFEQFLEAYNVKILNEKGQLLLDAPDARQGIIAALKQYASFYQDGYVPPRAVEWTGAGNNVSFLESESLMTLNSTVGIPGTQKLEQNQYNQQAAERYFKQIVTGGWPKKPDGGTLRLISTVKQIVIPKAAKNQEAAKSFLSYLLQPENLNRLLKEGSKGRILPVMTPLFKDPFWGKPTDPHLASGIRQYQQPNRPSYTVFHPAYSLVSSQNVWAKAILGIIQQDLSPKQAANGAIAQIKQIFAQSR